MADEVTTYDLQLTGDEVKTRLNLLDGINSDHISFLKSAQSQSKISSNNTKFIVFDAGNVTDY